MNSADEAVRKLSAMLNEATVPRDAVVWVVVAVPVSPVEYEVSVAANGVALASEEQASALLLELLESKQVQS